MSTDALVHRHMTRPWIDRRGRFDEAVFGGWVLAGQADDGALVIAAPARPVIALVSPHSAVFRARRTGIWPCTLAL
jgi:hypothetical protein